MAVALESSGRTTFWTGCYHFMATTMANYGGTWCAFVAGNERDRLEAASCPVVAVISRTKSKKLAKCCCCIATASLFRWFLARARLFSSNIWLGIFGRVEESLLEALVWLAAAWIGQTVASNFMTRFWFELLSFLVGFFWAIFWWLWASLAMGLDWLLQVVVKWVYW